MIVWNKIKLKKAKKEKQNIINCLKCNCIRLIPI
jgi:hypothetical protein